MAPSPSTLTCSNSLFLLSPITPPSHSLTTRRLTVLPKRPFSPLAKAADEAQNSSNATPFRFEFGKLPDVKSLVPLSPPSSGLNFGRRKDPGTVFVAGATGQAGIRIAQALLRQGFSVRAGVPDLAAAQELARLAAKYKIISNEESKRLNAVNSTFDDVESIAKAIGNASKVIVTIGPEENGPSAQVTIPDALQVIQAAQLANVANVAIVYDGSSGNSSTNNVLDGITSFFSNIFSRSQPLTVVDFLQRLVEKDLPYTLIKAELTEDFSPESSYNVVVSAEGSAGADYKVTRSQIASLVANVISNIADAENKVVQVSTSPSASSQAIPQVLRGIPEDKRRKLYAEALAKAKADEEAARASEQASESARKREEQEREEARAARLAAEAQNKAETATVESIFNKAKGMSSGFSWDSLSSQLKSAVQKPEEEPKVRPKKREQEDARAAKLAAEAQKKAETAAVENFFDKAKGMTSGFSWDNFSSQLKSAVQKPEEEPKVQLATARGQAKARSLPSQKALVKSRGRQPPPSKPKTIPQPKAKPTEYKTETRKVFGGLFKQETIYVDDD